MVAQSTRVGRDHEEVDALAPQGRRDLPRRRSPRPPSHPRAGRLSRNELNCAVRAAGRASGALQPAPAAHSTADGATADCATGLRLRRTAREVIDRTGVLVPHEERVPALQVTAQIGVVVQPPHRGGREHEIARPAVAEQLQLPDGVLAVRRVVAGVTAVVGAGEVPSACANPAAAGSRRPCSPPAPSWKDGTTAVTIDVT